MWYHISMIELFKCRDCGRPVYEKDCKCGCKIFNKASPTLYRKIHYIVFNFSKFIKEI